MAERAQSPGSDIELIAPLVDDDVRRADLRAMKARATGLLIVAAVVFIVARVFRDDLSWLSYVQAAAEGALVGGLADWFAVTALFRHPLGIPIPHTALVPARKDQLGRALGAFVESNFLTSSIISEKIRSAGLAGRVGEWLARDASATAVARDASALLAGTAGLLRDDAISGAIEQGLVGWVRRVPLAPVAGRALELATAEGRHEELVDAGLAGALRFLDDHREDLRGRFGRESPWWVPEAIDDRIFGKLFDGLRGFLMEVSDAPHHEFRAHLEARVQAFAQRLQSDPGLRARGEQIKEEILAHPAVQTWIGSLWADFKGALQRQSRDPSSELRQRIATEAKVLGQRLAADGDLQARVDRWAESAIGYLVEEHRSQAGDLIASTVSRWNPADASRRIELAVGRDLQFIRINGTVVGGLAGVAIHAVGQLIA